MSRDTLTRDTLTRDTLTRDTLTCNTSLLFVKIVDTVPHPHPAKVSHITWMAFSHLDVATLFSLDFWICKKIFAIFFFEILKKFVSGWHLRTDIPSLKNFLELFLWKNDETWETSFSNESFTFFNTLIQGPQTQIYPRATFQRKNAPRATFLRKKAFMGRNFQEKALK